MLNFLGRFVLLLILGWGMGYVFGAAMDSPEFAVGIFLIFSVSFRRAVFAP